MHANTFCTCNLMRTCDMLDYYNSNFYSRTIIQMTSLMHHSWRGMRNPNQCSTLFLKCRFAPLALCQFIIRMSCCNHIYMLGNNGPQDACTITWVEMYIMINYMVTCISTVYCTEYVSVWYSISLLYNQPNTNIIKGHVRMHVYALGAQRVK